MFNFETGLIEIITVPFEGIAVVRVCIGIAFIGLVVLGSIVLQLEGVELLNDGLENMSKLGLRSSRTGTSGLGIRMPIIVKQFM